MSQSVPALGFSALPFLGRFAEPVRILPQSDRRYDPATRRNVIMGLDCTDGLTGTLITETAENKDHSEHRIEPDGTLITRTREAADASEGDGLLLPRTLVDGFVIRLGDGHRRDDGEASRWVMGIVVNDVREAGPRWAS